MVMTLSKEMNDFFITKTALKTIFDNGLFINLHLNFIARVFFLV